MLLTNLYISFILIIFSPLVGRILKVSYDLFTLNKKLKNGNTLLELLNRLTPREFEIWSTEYLSSIGYKNVILTPPSINNGKNIICSKNNNTIYILCKSKVMSNKIASEDIEVLLGSMILDNVRQGIIITTSIVNDDIYKTIKNIPTPYKIDIIDFNVSKQKSNDFIPQIS